MTYRAIKTLGNNVLLAQQEDGLQVLLMGKGIGFGVKKGEIVDASGEDKTVFTVLDDRVDASRFKQLSLDEEAVRRATKEIVRLARKKLGITDEKLFDALLDHISFAVERMKIGLPIENPFIGEITILCAREYEIADAAAKLISDNLQVDIGEAERGFIALHLYSARRHKHINTAMKDARVYQQALEMIGRRFSREIGAQSAASKSFLMALNRLLSASSHEIVLEMPLKQHVRLTMREYDRIAKDVSDMIEREVGIPLGEDARAYLALDICRLVQLI